MKDYTVKPVGSSVGVSVPAFTRPWILNQYLTSPRGWLWAGTGQDAQGSKFKVVFYRDATTGEGSEDVFPDERLLCHVLLAELPDTALADAFESLADAWRDHNRALISVITGPGSAADRIGGGRIVSSRRADPVVIAEG